MPVQPGKGRGTRRMAYTGTPSNSPEQRCEYLLAGRSGRKYHGHAAKGSWGCPHGAETNRPPANGLPDLGAGQKPG
eukprot:86735-Heterocapsa_arctica.AAC.1